jgi:hypothetical protein
MVLIEICIHIGIYVFIPVCFFVTMEQTRGHFIILAVRYPAGTSFDVRIISNWWL